MNCTCFKCKNTYESEDESDIAGDGYCAICLEQKKIIVQEMDGKFSKRNANERSGRLSDLPSVTIKGIQLFSMKDVGL